MSKYTKCVCKACEKETIHYSKGMCRSCYTRALRHDFTIPELKKWDKQKKEKQMENKKKKQEIIDRYDAVKITTANEFTCPPRGKISCKVIDWYYNSTDKYLIFDCGSNKRMRNSIYNSIYAITIRRHHLNVSRYCREGKIIVERGAA